jgi:hypothetical protein
MRAAYNEAVADAGCPVLPVDAERTDVRDAALAAELAGRIHGLLNR